MFAAASMPPEGVRAAGAACFDGAPSIGLRDAAASGGWGRAQRAPSGVRAARLVGSWMFAAASMPPETSVLRELRALTGRPSIGLRDAAASSRRALSCLRPSEAPASWYLSLRE